MPLCIGLSQESNSAQGYCNWVGSLRDCFNGFWIFFLYKYNPELLDLTATLHCCAIIADYLLLAFSVPLHE